MEASQPIDLDHLERYVSGDLALRDEILTIFEEQVKMLGDQLNAKVDDDAWYNTMHAMKGASRGVGAWAIGDRCESAETFVDDYDDKLAARENVATELKTLIAEAVAEVKKLRDR